MTMNDKDFINRFVSNLEIEKNRYSCLLIAIQDARKLTSRNEFGKFVLDFLENENSYLNPYAFIGVINYLLVLDMIGEIFTLKAKSPPKIFRALKLYSPTLPEKDIYTIVALRNSLAHNYGLVNIPDNPKNYSMQRHKFSLSNSESSQLIEYPTRPWNGDFNDKSEETFTKIGVGKLIELIESVYQNLLMEILRSPTTTLALENGVDELKARFTITN